jgi:TolA-binding protein
LLVFLLISCSSPNLEDSLRRADALVGIGEYKKAAKIYRRLIEKNPRHQLAPGIWLRLGDLYANSLGDIAQGLDVYQKCIEADPYSEAARAAHERRAQIFELQGLTQSLVEEYAILLKYFPQAEYQLRLGEAFISNKDYQQARTELREFIDNKQTPKELRTRVLFDIGESYYLQGNPHEALRFYFAFLEEAPESELVSEVHLRIAGCFEELGRLGMAYKYTQKALEKYPNQEVVRQRLEALKKRSEVAPKQRK